MDGDDLGGMNLPVVGGNHQGCTGGERADHLRHEPITELEFQIEVGALETVYVCNVVEPVVVRVHMGRPTVEALPGRGNQ